MELSFDKRGNLIPYKKNELELAEFKGFFVEPFGKESTRHEIVENFEKYINQFRSEICPNFKLWINGSFVSNKLNPSDIDFVSLVDSEIATEKYNLLRRKFLNKQSLKEFNIDAYLVKIYNEDDKEYSKTHSDLLYWDHWFSHTKKNRMKKRYSKGFVEIVYDL